MSSLAFAKRRSWPTQARCWRRTPSAHLKPPAEIARLYARGARSGGRKPALPARDQLLAWTICATSIRKKPRTAFPIRNRRSKRCLGHGARKRYPDGIPEKVRNVAQARTRYRRPAQIRAILSHCRRYREVRALRFRQGRQQDRSDPLPGARLGGEFLDLLRARRHRSRSRRATNCCSIASFPRSAASRRTSTSISSTSGARR